MIGQLPKSLIIDGKPHEINSDFRAALLIFQAYNDNELNELEKSIVCLRCLYKEVPENKAEALKQAVWFLDGGDAPKPEQAPRKMMDWEQDESIIFPAVNKVAGFETRTAEYLHWWTFLGLFNEIGEGLYSTVMHIRSKQSRGKPLDKWEKEFYSSHKELVDLRQKLTPEEQAELEFIKNLVG